MVPAVAASLDAQLIRFDNPDWGSKDAAGVVGFKGCGFVVLLCDVMATVTGCSSLNGRVLVLPWATSAGRSTGVELLGGERSMDGNGASGTAVGIGAASSAIDEDSDAVDAGGAASTKGI